MRPIVFYIAAFVQLTLCGWALEKEHYLAAVCLFISAAAMLLLGAMGEEKRP